MAEILRIGIAGVGTVGASVVRLLAQQDEALQARTGRKVVVSAISARDRTKDRGFDTSAIKFFDDPVALAASEDIDLFVELIGGDEGPARLAVETALKHGKSVVTANKALLAKHGLGLAALAEEKRVALAYEASVAGGIPIVKTLREGLAGNSIERVYGILNGTCNYILSKMEMEELPFEVCLKEAQRLGYAEADPTFDIGGFDTAHKLAILASLAFGTEIDAEAISVEGIEHVTLADLKAADELGYRIKLLGVAQRTPHGVEQRVHPTMVRKTTSIAQVMGVTNAVTIDADAVHELTLVGPGAGGNATASAVVADIADIARGVRSRPLGLPRAALSKVKRVEMQRHEGGYYIRLAVFDKPGAFAGIAARMAERGISLESIVQRGRGGDQAGAPVPVVLITYATTEKLVREALDAIMADGFVAERPQSIRIERE
ncbi:MAG TPA: homoserine dehydrogenase [Beijerinckiaceae bacterium]|nr:homoserine dehydrogenase [Rhodoblastus sp.]MCC0001146.1 homoserine dehydrogenase [Methylobacteriaceae bacterium]MCC2102387.1 homoserine dehydrogenase [Hyphomicrobiales bacterium]HRY03787.1 homoserine dehydrogenase [Beijerinckiaceae bacterium]MCO5086764.1 homoserine dehydrogenase [Methylobacteriaceae bacterium]